MGTVSAYPEIGSINEFERKENDFFLEAEKPLTKPGVEQHEKNVEKVENGLANPENQKNMDLDNRFDKSNDGFIKCLASNDKDEITRDQWDGKFGFLMACLSFSRGLGTLWRFPYLVYRNGGGVFLIPYLVMNFIFGIPLFLVEMSLGQFSSSGLIKAWRLCPLFKGIGFGMMMVSLFLAPYYNVVIGWALVYLVESFKLVLPWSHCSNEWNTPSCQVTSANLTGRSQCNQTKATSTETLGELVSSANLPNHSVSISPADEYFHNHVVSISAGMHEWGDLNWRLVLALFVAWLLTSLVLIKGTKSSGKVAYFTAIFPYVVLLILFIRAMTIPGHMKGIEFYITPNWTMLWEPRVWGDAAVQVAFSLGLGWGAILTLASYKDFHANVIRDSVMIVFSTSITAIFCGFVIFAVLGVMAEAMGVEVKDVASGGAGLAFIVYPEAVTTMPFSPTWSVLFFLMIICLGIGTQIATVTTIVTTVTDASKILLRHKTIVTIFVCLGGFVVGLPLCSGLGMYLLQLMDNYVATWSVLIICVVECFVVTYVYGVNRFLADIEAMVRYRPCPIWALCWGFLTPAILIVIIVLTFLGHKGSSYREYSIPEWIDRPCFVLSFASVFCIPVTAIILLASNPRDFIKDRLRFLLKPTSDWAPLKQEDKRAREGVRDINLFQNISKRLAHLR